MIGFNCNLIGLGEKILWCHYFDKNQFWGPRCIFFNKESILPGSASEQYIFDGITNEQKSRVTALIFLTSNIAFIPKETFNIFPSLEQVGFEKSNIKILDYDWLNDIVKSLKPSIKYLHLSNNSINQIDPRTIKLLKKFDKVNLLDNECIQSDVFKPDYDKFCKNKLEKCIKNFDKNAGTVENKIEKIESFLGYDVCDLINKVEALEKNISRIESTYDNRFDDLSMELESLVKGLENSASKRKCIWTAILFVYFIHVVLFIFALVDCKVCFGSSSKKSSSTI